MLIPIYKVDEERRLVFGRAAQEVPDRAGEIMDYETAKPAFKSWSEETFEASGGKSFGNVRAMHGNVAAGRLDSIEFDDAAKAIDVCAHIVDDNEWQKVLEGVYTGFSMGGKYVKRWKDETGLTRYTPSVAEISIVDRPCVPTAQFAELVKTDGTVGQLMLKGAEMTEVVTEPEAKPEEAAPEAVKADDAAPQVEAGDEEAPAVEKAEEVATKEVAAEAEAAKADPLDGLKKYLGEEVWDAARAMEALEILSSLLREEMWEAEEGMPEPSEQMAALRDAIARVKAFIVSEIQENHDEGGEEGGEGEPMEMSDSGDIEKAGKAISAKNGEHLNAIHKAASDIAMRCAKMMGLEDAMTEADKADGAEGMTKTDGADALAKMAGELDELRKAHDAVTAERDDLLKAKAEWEAKPGPAKGIAKAVTKEEDNHAAPDAVAELQKRIEKMTPEQQAQEIIKFQMMHGGRAFLG